MITQQRLKQAVRYVQSTGLFYGRIDRHLRTKNKILGSLTAGGYLRLTIDRREYLAHRLAWFYVTGKWPADQIDHINGVRTDNRWANLREASHQANMQNRRVVGVGQYGRTRGFVARIGTGGTVKYLGTFPTEEEARQAYLAAKKIYHTAR